MVAVMVMRPFTLDGRNVFPGEAVELEPIDAAVKAHAGLVSLEHGHLSQTYQTREMVAAPVASESVQIRPGVFVSESSESIYAKPAKRRRGRPRKVR
jgi:hypothetical protein